MWKYGIFPLSNSMQYDIISNQSEWVLIGSIGYGTSDLVSITDRSSSNNAALAATLTRASVVS